MPGLETEATANLKRNDSKAHLISVIKAFLRPFILYSEIVKQKEKNNCLISNMELLTVTVHKEC